MTTASLLTAVTSLESAANMVPVIYKQTLAMSVAGLQKRKARTVEGLPRGSTAEQ